MSIAEDEETDGRVHCYAPSAQYVEHVEVGTVLEMMDSRSRRRVEQEIMCDWAGLLAEERLGETSEAERNHAAGLYELSDGEWMLGSSGDLRVLHEIAWRVHAGDDHEAEPFIEWLRRRTEGMLASEFVWIQVEAVAEALLVEHTLSGRRFREVARQAVEDWFEAQRREHPVFARPD